MPVAETTEDVAGVPAGLIATPASTEEAAEVLREAAGRDLAVVIRGGGTKIGWGMPPERLDLILDTSRLTGIVEHAAGDLITVVRSGTTMAELAEGLPGQQLALDAPLPGATVGGTVAANTSGPRRMLYGTARDLLIGITVVRPDGKVARAGGKVVKNVAGYDLGKLFTGSYGTLGLITECAFRLHPRPAAQAYVRAPVTDAGRAVAAVLAGQVVPSALEVDVPAGGAVEMAVLVEGSVAGVRDRAATLAKVLGGEIGGDPPDWWGAYPWGGEQAGVKLTAPLSKVPEVLAAATGVAVRGSAGAGVLYAAVEGDPATAVGVIERLRAACTRAGGHAVVLTAPPAVREITDMWGPVAGLTLMRRVKEQFDPGRRFAPGRFVGGI
jgi:glycolate dehydrogenase FAD-binding subunit